MTETTSEMMSNPLAGDLDLGVFLGRQQAFGLMGGRCSAAQAVCLREIHSRKLYKNRCRDWGRFCRDHLHMARSSVEAAIALLNEFGPGYFELSQLIRISPEAYRAIRPTIQDHALHVDGEAIALVPENMARIAAAVASMRNAARARREAGPEPAAKHSQPDPLNALAQLCGEVVERFETLAANPRLSHELAEMLVRFQTRLDRVQSRL